MILCRLRNDQFWTGEKPLAFNVVLGEMSRFSKKRSFFIIAIFQPSLSNIVEKNKISNCQLPDFTALFFIEAQLLYD